MVRVSAPPRARRSGRWSAPAVQALRKCRSSSNSTSCMGNACSRTGTRCRGSRRRRVHPPIRARWVRRLTGHRHTVRRHMVRRRMARRLADGRRSHILTAAEVIPGVALCCRSGRVALTRAGSPANAPNLSPAPLNQRGGPWGVHFHRSADLFPFFKEAGAHTNRCRIEDQGQLHFR